MQTITIHLPEAVQKQLERVEKKLDQLLQGDNNLNSRLGEFYTEDEAKKILGKKTTWFYYKRKEGLLKSHKLGSKNVYLMSDLLKLVKDDSAE